MELQVQIPKIWFDHGYALLISYLRDHPGLSIEGDYKAADGFLLGIWITEIRFLWKEGFLTYEQIRKLETIGFSKDPEDQSWESMYRLLRNRIMEKGDVPQELQYKTEDGVMLGAWKDRQERLFLSLPEEKREKLRKLGFGDRTDED